MHDIKMIRDAPAVFASAMRRRGVVFSTDDVLDLDRQRRGLVGDVQKTKEALKQLSREAGTAKATDDEVLFNTRREEQAHKKAQMLKHEAALPEIEARLLEILSALPNIPLEDVPDGGEAHNRELRCWGGVDEAADFRAHYELAASGGLMDFETSADISGSRFVMLRGGLARLERALGQFMIDLHISEHDYCEIAPPFLVRGDALFGTGQLPKFSEDLFKTSDDLWLIPTAEVPLSNIGRDMILDSDTLPLRFTALTPCFRSEAGSAGRDTRGMIRLRQFMKCELVSLVLPDSGASELERMTGCAEAILQALELPYRVMLLSAEDMGFAACKTYDLEVWMPAQKKYREISSCSYCGDFQACRMGSRYRDSDSRKPRFVHTLNGSALAVGRTLAALIETYGQDGGRIAIPRVLQKYMGGTKVLEL